MKYATGSKEPMPRPPKKPPTLAIVKKSAPILDYPLRDLPVPTDDGKPSGLTMPIQFVPWIDTLPAEELHQALIEEDTPRTTQFLKLLSDPVCHDLPMSTLAGRCGIRVPELMEIWRSHMKIAAMGVALSKAPVVAQHTIEDAQSQIVCCSRCDGAGEISVIRRGGPVWITCMNCKGKGEVSRPGDPKSREWVLRAAGVVAADQGLTIINNQNNVRATDSVLDELERLDRNTTIDIVDIPRNDA
jgi:hypothetical protein